MQDLAAVLQVSRSPSLCSKAASQIPHPACAELSGGLLCVSAPADYRLRVSCACARERADAWEITLGSVKRARPGRCPPSLTNTVPFASWFLVTGDVTSDRMLVVRSVHGAISSLPIVADACWITLDSGKRGRARPGRGPPSCPFSGSISHT